MAGQGRGLGAERPGGRGIRRRKTGRAGDLSSNGPSRAHHFGVRWQAKRDTALARAASGVLGCSRRPKAPSPLRSAGALQSRRVGMSTAVGRGGSRCAQGGRPAGIGDAAREVPFANKVIIGRIGCGDSLVRWRDADSFFFFFAHLSALFHSFPLAGPFYRAILNGGRPGGLRARPGGQSGVVSSWEDYMPMLHILSMEKMGWGARTSPSAKRAPAARRLPAYDF